MSIGATPSPGQRSIRASGGSREMKRHIFAHESVLRDILAETVESARSGGIRESGRTFCPTEPTGVYPPKGRYPLSVSLRSCHIGSSGIVHTHVTHGELRSPEHSLPDMANILTTDLDASVVLGTDTADVMLSPEDPGAALSVFSQAIGIDVGDTQDVVDALETGVISPSNAPALRQRVRRRLSGLFERERVGFGHLRREVDQLREADIISPAIAASGPIAGCQAHQGGGGSRALALTESMRDAADEVSFSKFTPKASDSTDSDSTPVDIKSDVIGTAVGVIAARGVTWLIFGDGG